MLWQWYAVGWVGVFWGFVWLVFGFVTVLGFL